jgi:hypothetical protein
VSDDARKPGARDVLVVHGYPVAAATLADMARWTKERLSTA